MQSVGNAASFQPLPWEKDQSLPWVNEDRTVNEKLKKTYDQHKHLIYKKRITDMKAFVNYNFPTTDSLDINQITHQIEQFFFESPKHV